MPLYEVTDDGLKRHASATFDALGFYERVDIQRLLRDDIGVLGEDLLVVAEEFGAWENARRRIDLLALDKAGRLVVIEVKRTEDGGHMDLQAIRYAAMVSSMEFAEVVTAYERHCTLHRPDEDLDARGEIESFLDPDDEVDEATISTDVRILLVAADFGREITSTVLWLNSFDGMDVRCVKLVPYEIDGRVLLDVQQVLPLPEAADYQVKIRRKDAARERARRDGRDFTRYHIVVDGVDLPDENKRNSIRVMVQQLVARGVSPSSIVDVLPGRRIRRFDGRLHQMHEVEEAPSVSRPRYRDEPLVLRAPLDR